MKTYNTKGITEAHRWLCQLFIACFDSTAYSNFANIGCLDRSHLHVINRCNWTWGNSLAYLGARGVRQKYEKMLHKRRGSKIKSDTTPRINAESKIELEFTHKL